MAKTSKSPRTVESGSELSRLVEITQVRLLGADVGFVEKYFSERMSVTISHRAAGQLKTEPSRLTVAADFKMEALPESAEDKPAVRVRAVFELIYSVPAGTTATPDVLNDFATTNGIFNAWPYWRELLQSMTTRMGLPGFVSPVLRLKPPEKSIPKSKRAATSQNRARK